MTSLFDKIMLTTMLFSGLGLLTALVLEKTEAVKPDDNRVALLGIGSAMLLVVSTILLFLSRIWLSE